MATGVISSKKCVHAKCGTRASYGVPGKKFPEFCWQHAHSLMKLVLHMRCTHPNERGIQSCQRLATYGLMRDVNLNFCKIHADEYENMVEILLRKCAKAKCTKPRTFGVDGTAHREYCDVHAKPGMVEMAAAFPVAPPTVEVHTPIGGDHRAKANSSSNGAPTAPSSESTQWESVVSPHEATCHARNAENVAAAPRTAGILATQKNAFRTAEDSTDTGGQDGGTAGSVSPAKVTASGGDFNLTSTFFGLGNASAAETIPPCDPSAPESTASQRDTTREP